MKFQQELASELAKLHQHHYIVERYLAGLAQLTVVAYEQECNTNPVFITFRSVEYMQMPTYWREAPFVLGTSEQCWTLLEQVGIDAAAGLPSLFYAQLPKSRVHVVCWSVEITTARWVR